MYMKKKFVLVIIFLVTILSLLGQEEGRMTFALRDQKGKLLNKFTIVLIDGKQVYDSTFIRYYSSGEMQDSCYYDKGIIVGNAYTYDKKGRITSITEFIGKSFPRKINTKSYYYSGSCRYIEGGLIEYENGEYKNDGIFKYYWKNGQVMDSAIYENGTKIYRARFNKKGQFEFEQKYGKETASNLGLAQWRHSLAGKIFCYFHGMARVENVLGSRHCCQALARCTQAVESVVDKSMRI